MTTVPRLFSAVELPDFVAADLEARLDKVRSDADVLRWVEPESWHITLGFYGNREHADRRGAWLRRRATGLVAPRIRLASAGGFPGVLWIGVDAASRSAEHAMHAVAAAAKADEGDEVEFRPHVTVARWRRAGSRRLRRSLVDPPRAGALLQSAQTGRHRLLRGRAGTAEGVLTGALGPCRFASAVHRLVTLMAGSGCGPWRP
jgi:2'-5' RNA ligase